MSENVHDVLDVDVVTASTTEWEGPAKFVVVPVKEGEVGLLPGHASLLALMGDGRIRITGVDGEMWEATISGGFVSVDDDRVTVVVDEISHGTAA